MMGFSVRLSIMPWDLAGNVPQAIRRDPGSVLRAASNASKDPDRQGRDRYGFTPIKADQGCVDEVVDLHHVGDVRRSAPAFAHMSVRVPAGRTAWTKMPFGAASAARPWERVRMYALVAA